MIVEQRPPRASDRRHRAWRLVGRLVCDCDVPSPRSIALFNATECAICYRLVVGRVGEELVYRTLELVEDEP